MAEMTAVPRPERASGSTSVPSASAVGASKKSSSPDSTVMTKLGVWVMSSSGGCSTTRALSMVRMLSKNVPVTDICMVHLCIRSSRRTVPLVKSESIAMTL